MWIELNDAEQRLARFLAKERHATNRSKNHRNRRIGPQSDEDTDLEGIAAEIAYCKATNTYPDLSLEIQRADCVTGDGRTVDVKSTRYSGGHLVAVITKAGKETDLYALMVGTFPRYRFAGIATADELICQESIRDFGHGPTYAIPQNRLRRTA